MIVKKRVLVALLGGMLALTPSAPAIEPPQKEDKPATRPERRTFAARGDRLQHVAEELKLTDHQKEQLKPILKEQAQTLRDLRQEQASSHRDLAGKLRELRQSTEEKLKPILTPEQFQKWKELRSEGPRRRKQE